MKGGRKVSDNKEDKKNKKDGRKVRGALARINVHMHVLIFACEHVRTFVYPYVHECIVTHKHNIHSHIHTHTHSLTHINICSKYDNSNDLYDYQST